MKVDDGLEIDIGSLILVGRRVISLVTQLRHATIGTEGQAIALDVDPLAAGILAVQGGLTQFEVDATGCVLNIDLLIKVTRTVLGNHLTFDPYIAAHDQGLVIVHRLEVMDGGDGLQSFMFLKILLIDTELGIRLIIFTRQHRLPFLLQTLAGNERSKYAKE